MKKLLTIPMFILILSLAIDCKKEEEPVEEEVTTEEAEPTEKKSANPKIKEFEDFVAKFCSLTEKMKSASVTESVALAKDFATESATLTKLQTDINDIKAASDEDAKARIDKATKKAKACAASAASAKTKTPSASDLKKEIPKEIPKKIPGF